MLMRAIPVHLHHRVYAADPRDAGSPPTVMGS
jgi:hypothetical protein